MVDAGVNVALGTDSTASNNSLDMLFELKLAAVLAKGHTYNPETIPAAQALKLATINGAKAMGMEVPASPIESHCIRLVD